MSHRFEDARLDALRHVGDQLADAAWAEIRSARVRGGGDLAEQLDRGAEAGLPACRRLRDQVNDVPAWVDFPSMLLGYRKSLRNPVQAGLALLVGSLVESYASASGAKVLIRTGRLEADTRKRVYETGEFVRKIGMSEGPRPGTAAHRHIVSVRLVHAAVRVNVSRRPDWQSSFGVPVNQEDYASTLLMFGHVFVRSLSRLGVEFTADEAASVQHTWRYVGFVMGVDDELLTRSTAEERRLYDVIARRRLHPDDDSRTLVQELFQALAGQPPHYLPEPALAALSRRCVGADLADALRVPRSRAWDWATAPISPVSKWANRCFGASPVVAAWAERAGSALVTSSIEKAIGAFQNPHA